MSMLRTIRNCHVALLVASLNTGCILMMPVTDFAARSPDGRVSISNCVGMQSVQHERDGARIYVRLYGSGTPGDPAWLRIVLTPAQGTEITIADPRIRIQPLDDRAETSLPLPQWERSALRLKKHNQLERITVETAPPGGPVPGDTPINEPAYFAPSQRKSFFVQMLLQDLHAAGYRITLPPMRMNDREHRFAPMEFHRQLRLEWLVPFNC